MNPFITIFYQPLYNLLFWIVSLVPGQSFAAGIIILTVAVRILLMPLQAQALRSQRELQALQPKMDALREQYKDKPEELNQATLALYQEHKINPFSSCLPLLIQLPILLLLYHVFMNGLGQNDTALLYPFVQAPSQLNVFFFGIDLSKPSWILGLLAGVGQFVQTWQILNQQKSFAPVKKKDKSDDPSALASQISSQLAYLMPVITVIVSLGLPAALALYWIITTLFQIGQQWWLLRTQPALAAPHVAVSIRTKTK